MELVYLFAFISSVLFLGQVNALSTNGYFPAVSYNVSLFPVNSTNTFNSARIHTATATHNPHPVPFNSTHVFSAANSHIASAGSTLSLSLIPIYSTNTFDATNAYTTPAVSMVPLAPINSTNTFDATNILKTSIKSTVSPAPVNSTSNFFLTDIHTSSAISTLSLALINSTNTFDPTRIFPTGGSDTSTTTTDLLPSGSATTITSTTALQTVSTTITTTEPDGSPTVYVGPVIIGGGPGGGLGIPGFNIGGGGGSGGGGGNGNGDDSNGDDNNDEDNKTQTGDQETTGSNPTTSAPHQTSHQTESAATTQPQSSHHVTTYISSEPLSSYHHTSSIVSSLRVSSNRVSSSTIASSYHISSSKVSSSPHVSSSVTTSSYNTSSTVTTTTVQSSQHGTISTNSSSIASSTRLHISSTVSACPGQTTDDALPQGWGIGSDYPVPDYNALSDEITTQSPNPSPASTGFGLGRKRNIVKPKGRVKILAKDLSRREDNVKKPQAEARQNHNNDASFKARSLGQPHHLAKRMNCFRWISSLITTPKIPQEWWCDSLVPGVDSCRAKIQEWATNTAARGGRPGTVPSVFYTSSEVYGNLPSDANKWAAAKFGCDYKHKGFTIWDYMVDFDWTDAVTKRIARPFKALSKNVEAAVDPFLKNLSQAYAEESAGDAYLVLPSSKNGNWDPASAWAGWEYPALKRNKRITNIYRIDMTKNAFDSSNPTAPLVTWSDPILIWSQGDNVGDDPKGDREDEWPVGMPTGAVPSGTPEVSSVYIPSTTLATVVSTARAPLTQSAPHHAATAPYQSAPSYARIKSAAAPLHTLTMSFASAPLVTVSAEGSAVTLPATVSMIAIPYRD